MDEEDVLCRFGSPLEPLEEDEVPSKKPVITEEQIVTDANGKRRFHGAFTGGFSAGFWNTVGSLEGWKPQSFRSSRFEKADRMSQKPTDFMDVEDLGEFGIAPQRVQTKEEFRIRDTSGNIGRRRAQQLNSSSRTPVAIFLRQLLQPAKDNIAKRLLKKMGWKEGQGIGARLSKREKIQNKERFARERYFMEKYGCDSAPLRKTQGAMKDESGSEDISDNEITFAPDDFEAYGCGIKDNFFGLGYSGLSRDSVIKKQNVNVLGEALEVIGRGNKRLSIRGQAFGVGALEEEDEDIYAKDDMAKYDFSLEGAKQLKSKDRSYIQDKNLIDGFQAPDKNSNPRKKVFNIVGPKNFKPRNFSVRRTRFAPLDEKIAEKLQKEKEHIKKGLARHHLNPEVRGNVLEGTCANLIGVSLVEPKTANIESVSGPSDDNIHEKVARPNPLSYLEKINKKYKARELLQDIAIFLGNDRFSNDEVLDEMEAPVISNPTVLDGNERLITRAKKLTKGMESKPSGFKPFMGNPEKQSRYENFVEAKLRTESEILTYLNEYQPLNMNDWDRELEMKEFLQARSIYKPLKGLMSDRFVTESAAVDASVAGKKTVAPKVEKKFELHRMITLWKPSATLCKKFNISQPVSDKVFDLEIPKKRKFSVFDYVEVSTNSKKNFVAPNIQPTRADKFPLIIQEPMQKITEFNSSNEATTLTSTRSTSLTEIPKKRFGKPKTELEKKVIETKNQHPSEKKDLFSSIFGDSGSEDDIESALKQPVTNFSTSSFSQSGETRKRALDELISEHKRIFDDLKSDVKHQNIMNSINTNDAEPKPSSASLLPPKIIFQKRENREKFEAIIDHSFNYGPKPPTMLYPKVQFLTKESNVGLPILEDDGIDRMPLNLIINHKKDLVVTEEWVEKVDAALDSSKKKKKKKDKSKDKKKTKKNKKDKKKKKDKI